MNIEIIRRQLERYKKCSIGKYTRLKDARNFLANLVHELDMSYNVEPNFDDAKNKCQIFGINHLCQDFTNGKDLTGAMEHLVPLAAELRSKNRIGSDSFWNRIPVSGTNRTYNQTPEHADKVKKWLDYVNNRRGETPRLFYEVDYQFFKMMKEREESLISVEDNYRKKAKKLFTHE